MTLFNRLLLLPFLLLNVLAAAPHVQAVMFFSPDCAHCHEVIEEELLPMMKEHAGQLEFILINVSTDDGARLFYEVVDAHKIPDEELGVPTLLIGEHLLIGADQIPKRFPRLLAIALEKKEPTLASIPGLSAAIAESHVTHRVYHDGERDIIIIDREADLKDVPSPTIQEKLASDPIGSSLAIFLLVVMTASLILVLRAWVRDGFAQGRCKPIARLIPFLCGIGLLIGAYLGYIEMTGAEAICGFVGNCEAVQKSSHSYLFGLFPIGIVGAVGYLIMIGLWFWRHRSPPGHPSPADWILPTLIYISVIFSLYLTFLEPFVIGAICMWCLLSASIITGLLWLTHPATRTYASKKRDPTL